MYAKEYYANLEMARRKQDALYHHGIIGQKWGVRRFQDENGRYTPAGRERYGIGKERDSADISDDSDGKYSGATAALIVLGLAGLQLGTAAVHDAIISKGIKNYEAHRATEETDPKTGLKLKSNPDATIKEDMKFINREFKKSFLNQPFDATENCMLCTTALDLKRRGYDVTAGKSATGYYATDIKKWYKQKDQNEIKMDRFDDLLADLTKQPEGSYGNFMCYWKEGGGHSMFYRIEKGKPVIYDAQSNKVYSMNTIRRHADKKMPGTAYIRLDNMEPDYEYLKENKLIG